MARRSFFLLLWLAIAPALAAESAARQHVREGNYHAAAELLREESKSNPESAYLLARLYLRGVVEPETPESVEGLLQQAAAADIIEAAFLLGTWHEEQGNRTLALRWFEDAATGGHQRASLRIERLNQNLDTAKTQADKSCEELKPADANALFVAIECSDAVSHVERLLQAGADLYVTDSQGNGLLHKAVAAENVAMSKALLGRNLDPDQRNHAGWSPAMLASRSDNKQLRNVLNPGDGSRRQVETEVSEQFRGWSPLSVAAWHGDHERVQTLLATQPTVVDSTTKTPVHRALQRGHGDIVVMLLEGGHKVEDSDVDLLINLDELPALSTIYDTLTRKQRNMLRCAAIATGHALVIQAPTRFGLETTGTCENLSYLAYAAKQGQTRAVVSLLDYATVDHGPTHCGALCWALRGDQVEMAELLLQAGGSDSNDEAGVSNLMLAASAGFTAIVNKLLESGANVNHTSHSGSHALYLAAVEGHDEVVNELLDHGAEIDLKNKIGDTALMAAIRADRYETAQLLVGRGASVRARNHKKESATTLADQKADARWRELMHDEEGLWDLVTRD